MNKNKRQLVYNKYGGLCAYTGKPLESDWQIDHMMSKRESNYINTYRISQAKDWNCLKLEIDHIDNLMPALRIVNHYKRAFDLEGFRKYMLYFHLRLAKYPKNPIVVSSIKRKEYMYKVADAFDITTNKPFSGIFYFETLESN